MTSICFLLNRAKSISVRPTWRLAFIAALSLLLVDPTAWGESIDARLAGIFRPSENWSVAVARLSDRRVLFETRADEPRVPASNMKLYVTATAFDLLGTRYRYRTPLMGRGSFDRSAGVWRGDVLVRGSGDPTFSGRFEDDSKNVTARLDLWADRLVKHGVRRIEGNLYGDDGIFDEDYWVSGWPDGSWCDWYTAPSGGLIFNDSCLDIGVYPGGGVGKPPVIKLVPDTDFVRIQNSAKTVGRKSKSAVSFRRTFGQNDLKLLGKIPSGSRGSQHCVAIADPTDYFLTVLDEVFAKHGIEVTGETMDSDEAVGLPTRGWKVLAWNESPPLETIAQVINTRSQNLYADALLKTLGARKMGMGNWAGGQRVVKDWVRSQGIPAEHLHLQDGSGLSRLNRVTARDTLSLLLKIKDKAWFPSFKNTLAVSGRNPGSLRKRLTTRLLKGKVRAKTGFINYTYCLSGYLESKSGKEYAFSMLFNGKNHAGKHPHGRMEQALTLLAEMEP